MEAKTEVSKTDACIWPILGKPPSFIKAIIEKKLLNLKLRGSENIPALRKKYFSILKNILMKKKHMEEEKNQQPGIVFTYLKTCSSISLILPELMSFITSELKTIDKLKPAIVLKAFYCLFLNDNVFVENSVSLNIVCTNSLKKFLANLLNCCDLGYLIKDIAADIWYELVHIFLSDISTKVPSCNFHYLQEAHEDFYGVTVAWLSSMTHETVGGIHWETLYSKKFLRRTLNFPKLFAKLVIAYQYHVYCCLPSQIADVSVNETHSLYHLKLVNQIFYNLIRDEGIYTPIFLLMYKPKTSKPFKFSDLLFEVNLRELLEFSPHERHERDMPDVSDRPPPRKKRKKSPKNFYASRTCSLYMGNKRIWSYWNVFFGTGTYTTDIQLVFFGYLSPLLNRMFDIYSWEKAGICHISTSSPDENPFNLEGQDGFNLF